MNLTDVKILKTDSFKDERGELWTIWNKKEFSPKLNITWPITFPILSLQYQNTKSL